MARKRELASKLSGQGEEAPARPGWRDAITGLAREEAAQPAQADERRAAAAQREAARRAQEQEEEAARRAARRRRGDLLMRKTYLLTPELVEHVAELAETERVGINELVRFLLRASLEQV